MQEREADLLRQHGHQVARFTVDNKEIAGLGAARTGIKAIWNSRACRQVRDIINEFRPDVAHVHTPFPILSPAIFHVTKSANVPTVATMHSYRYTCVNALLYRNGNVCEECVGKRFSWPAVVHRCYKNSSLASSAMAVSLATHHVLGTFQRDVDRYITLTEFARRKLIADHFPADKIVVKPNFVNCDTPPGSGGGGYALFVGRLVAEKGVVGLVDAWAQLKDIDLRLKIVGDGPLREDLARRAEVGGGNVEFLGWKEGPEVLELMRQAELLVFPSEWYEAGCTLVMMEAFASGTPVLASDVGNFSEAIRHDEIGWLFKTGDANDLARVVRRIDRTPASLARMRRLCFVEFQQRYSPAANYQMLMQIYDSVVPSTSR